MDHLTTEQLEGGLELIRQSPTEDGRLEMIVQRPTEGERVVLDIGELNTEEGLAGDSWNVRGSRRTDDGTSHPDMQINIMNSRVLALVAQRPDRMHLAGDQLVVDLDLSAINLPAWTRLAIGDAVIDMSGDYHPNGEGAIIEITDQPHSGCGKFTRRFGLEAHRFVNSELGKELRLRGVNARVLVPGTIRQGDVIRKI